MKLCYLIGVLFLGVVICRNIASDAENKVDDSSEEYTLNPNDTAQITAKCIEVGGEAAAKKFNVALQSTISCLKNQSPKTKEELQKEISTDKDDTSICSKRRKAIRGCFTEVIEAIKDCSVEQEKYAPEFLFDALDSLLDFVCAEDSKIVKDLITSNHTWTCAENILEKAITGNLTYVCTENFKLLQDNEDNIFTKPELCTDLHTAKTCYSKFLTTECPLAKELNLFLVGVFDSISSPCKTDKVKRQAIK